MTNFERIKAMSVEEMAILVLDFDREYAEYILSDGTVTCSQEEAIEDAKKWLESEVEEE
jgi:hypothetical protein